MLNAFTITTTRNTNVCARVDMREMATSVWNEEDLAHWKTTVINTLHAFGVRSSDGLYSQWLHRYFFISFY